MWLVKSKRGTIYVWTMAPVANSSRSVTLSTSYLKWVFCWPEECLMRLHPHPTSREASYRIWVPSSHLGWRVTIWQDYRDMGGIVMLSAQCCSLNNLAWDESQADCDCLKRFHYVIIGKHISGCCVFSLKVNSNCVKSFQQPSQDKSNFCGPFINKPV